MQMLSLLLLGFFFKMMDLAGKPKSNNDEEDDKVGWSIWAFTQLLELVAAEAAAMAFDVLSHKIECKRVSWFRFGERRSERERERGLSELCREREKKWVINRAWGGEREGGICCGPDLRHPREDHVVVLWKGHLGIGTGRSKHWLYLGVKSLEKLKF